MESRSTSPSSFTNTFSNPFSCLEEGTSRTKTTTPTKSTSRRLTGSSKAVKAAQCPKLASFEAFKGCGYRKTTNNCTEPAFLKSCPLPRFDMKRGALEPDGVLSVFLPPGCLSAGLLHLCHGALWGGPAGRWGHQRAPPELHRESHHHCQRRPEARSHGAVVACS